MLNYQRVLYNISNVTWKRMRILLSRGISENNIFHSGLKVGSESKKKPSVKMRNDSSIDTEQFKF